MTEEDLLDELAAIRLRFSKPLDETLGRLAAWIEEHPDAEPEEAERTPEAREALRLVDAEIRAVSALLTEVLPALVQKAVQIRGGQAHTEAVTLTVSDQPPTKEQPT